MCIRDRCEQIKKPNKLQGSVNNELKSNIEQLDTIKTSVTNLKSKHTEHEQEIIKVREDLSLAINQKLTNMCERVNVDVELCLSLIHIF